jgi:hypothetical protein
MNGLELVSPSLNPEKGDGDPYGSYFARAGLESVRTIRARSIFQTT